MPCPPFTNGADHFIAGVVLEEVSGPFQRAGVVSGERFLPTATGGLFEGEVLVGPHDQRGKRLDPIEATVDFAQQRIGVHDFARQHGAGVRLAGSANGRR